MLAMVAACASSSARAAIKNVILFIAAPLVGWVYVVALPLVGVTIITKIHYKSSRQLCW